MRKRKRKWDKSIIILLIIIIIVLTSFMFAYYHLRTDLFTETLKKGSVLSILFAISGDQDYRFFELLMYNPETHKASIVFIPANVGLIIESLKRIDRIDVLYRPGNLDVLKTKVEEITGTDVQFFADLNEANVVALVDILKGLGLFIPNPVDLDQKAEKILLPSGSVVLDGDKVKDFISYKDPLESEMDWTSRKLKFLQALLKRIGESSNFLLHKETFPLLKKIFVSNLSSRALESFVLEMGKLDSDRIIFQRVLGSIRVVDNKELLFPHFNGKLLKETIKQTRETIASHEVLNEEEMTLTIELLNGTQVTGLARRAANVYMSFGYDIVSVGNADNDQYLKTVVLDRKGKPEAARRAAELIKCSSIYSRMNEEGDLSIDVTIILGKDFDGRYCKN